MSNSSPEILSCSGSMSFSFKGWSISVLFEDGRFKVEGSQ
jgi:hypothetical protein